MSLARMVGGSLLGQKVDGSHESVLFDVSIRIELQRMHAKDMNTTLESLTSVIGPRLTQGQALFHVNVQPVVKKLVLQTNIDKQTTAERCVLGQGR